MFVSSNHVQLASSLESIAAAFAVLQVEPGTTRVTLVSANTLFEEITGRPTPETIGATLDELLPGSVEKSFRICIARCLRAQTSQDDEVAVERNATKRWWRLVMTPIINAHAHGQRLMVTLIDITEKKALERKLLLSRERFEAVVEATYDGIVTIDESQTIKLMNASARRIFGVGEAPMEGVSLLRFMPQRFNDKHRDHVKDFRDSTISARPMQSRRAVLGRRADGTEFPVEITIAKIAVGHNIEMTAVIRDVSEREQLMKELSEAAIRDPMTGLFNRRHAMRVMGEELTRSKRFDHAFTVAILDIDDFKRVNDQYGHSCGDQVLIEVSRAMTGMLRETDMLCRWGGEEFLALLPETSSEDAVTWAERARLAVEQTRVRSADGREVKVTISIGLATMRRDTTLDVLIDLADKALYQSKTLGRNRVSVA